MSAPTVTVLVAGKPYPPMLPNVWLGTSIELDTYSWRADYVRTLPEIAGVRWLSLEPLLGPLPSLDLKGIDWVVVGGETGRRARPMHSAWVQDIRARCNAAGIPFLFKLLCTKPTSMQGLDGAPCPRMAAPRSPCGGGRDAALPTVLVPSKSVDGVQSDAGVDDWGCEGGGGGRRGEQSDSQQADAVCHLRLRSRAAPCRPAELRSHHSSEMTSTTSARGLGL